MLSIGQQRAIGALLLVGVLAFVLVAFILWGLAKGRDDD